MDTKSACAKKVLQLMDSVPDGADRYSEFVAMVAENNNVSEDQIHKDLELFI